MREETANWIEQLSRVISPGRWCVGEPMSRHTTFRIGGSADLFLAPTLEELTAVLPLAGEKEIPVTVLGNGSNVLVCDEGIRGIVLAIGKGMDTLSIEGNIIRAEAGCLLSKVSNAAAEAGLSGLEFAAGIPGSIGGAVVMNAGAYGGEIKDVLLEAGVLTAEGKKKRLTAEELALSYRHSCIPKKQYIVTDAVFQLTSESREEIRSRMEELKQKRVLKQPLEYPSAGSTFKRPEGYFAGKLIQDAGLCGYTVGEAQISKKHCGFVINTGKATAAQVRQLIGDVQDKVFEQFQVRLEPEVKLLGEWAEDKMGD